MFNPFQNTSRKSCVWGGVFTLLHRALRLCKSHKGGILIEFTFSIPVCIFLLFFVNDHYRFYELKSKVRTSTYLAASMIQHVTNKRTDKQLTMSDLARITYASCLNLFHTNSMFYPNPLGLYLLTRYHYVKRINQNSYQLHKCYCATSRHSIKDMDKNFGALQTVTAADVEAIHPDLICSNDGEERVYICSVYKKAYDSIKSKLGFLLLEPKTENNSGAHGVCFQYGIVITPKPGLFPVTE